MKRKRLFLILVVSLFMSVVSSRQIVTLHSQSTPILVDPIGNQCGPNSFLSDAGTYAIDWGGDELEFKTFSLIEINSFIDPEADMPLKQIALQFVAEPLPSTLTSEITGSAPYGARLYQATYGTAEGGAYQTRDLLYNNKKNGEPFAKPTNVGRAADGVPFIAFAGVETAYPNQEHGLYANVQWAYTIRCEQEGDGDTAVPRWVFRANAPSSIENDSQPDFALTTYIDGASWVQTIEDTKPALDYMFYSNIMIPSGGQDGLNLLVDEIEVVSDEIESIVIHSSTGSPWGDYESGDIYDYSSTRFNDPNRVRTEQWQFPNQYEEQHGSIPKDEQAWLGWFVKNGKSYNDAFENLVNEMAVMNHDQDFQIQLSSQGGYYPKLFCGPSLTVDWSDDKLAYCEVWVSPNAPSFWHGPNGLAHFGGFTVQFTPGLVDVPPPPIDADYYIYLPVVIRE